MSPLATGASFRPVTVTVTTALSGFAVGDGGLLYVARNHTIVEVDGAGAMKPVHWLTVGSTPGLIARPRSGKYLYFTEYGTTRMWRRELATGATVEGQATAHYIGELARAAGARVTRIAHGVPIGGDLEHLDGGTLAHAFAGRHELD